MTDLPINQIIVGDCLEVMKGWPDGCVDMVLCDLPYGTTKNKWDSIIPMGQMWEQFERVSKSGAAMVLTGQDKFSAMLMLSNAQNHRYNLVWVKNRATGFLNASRMPMRSHEDILVFYRELPVYNPQMTFGAKNHSRGNTKTAKNSCYGTFDVAHKGNDYGNMKHPDSVLYFDREHPPEHPTQKPVSLFEYLVRTYTNEGDVVLDACAGVGTTAVACERSKRNWVCIEIEPKYAEIARQRIAKEQAQGKLFT